MGEQELSGEHTAGHRGARAVEIGEHGIEQSRSLDQTRFQRVPVARGDHQRKCVQMPRPRHGRAVAVGDRVTVGVLPDVGDSVVVHQLLYDAAQLLEPVPATLADAVGQFEPCRPDTACRVDEFVVSGDRATSRVEQRLLCPRRAIAGQQVVDVVRIRRGDCHQCRTVRIRRRSRMPGAPTSVDWRACFSRMSEMSRRPGVNPVASNRRPLRDSASTALTGGVS